MRAGCRDVCRPTICDTRRMKGSQKPKKLQKKQPQKTLKERRAEKRANAKQNRFGDLS